MSIEQIGIPFHALHMRKGKLRKIYEAVFKCSCGKVFICTIGNSRRTQSCGCSRLGSGKTHGLSGTRVFKAWSCMMHRCYDEKDSGFKNYNKRGIKVVDEWHDVEKFAKDMGNPPDKFTLERIDNDKGYFKDNCKWASRLEQARNRSTNRMVTIKGITKCVVDWSLHEGVTVKSNTISRRLRKGWDPEKAVFQEADDKCRNFIYRDKKD